MTRGWTSCLNGSNQYPPEQQRAYLDDDHATTGIVLVYAKATLASATVASKRAAMVEDELNVQRAATEAAGFRHVHKSRNGPPFWWHDHSSSHREAQLQ